MKDIAKEWGIDRIERREKREDEKEEKKAERWEAWHRWGAELKERGDIRAWELERLEKELEKERLLVKKLELQCRAQDN